MGSTLCHRCQYPEEKAAWDRLNAAETELEELMKLQPPLTVAKTPICTYFIHEGRLLVIGGSAKHPSDLFEDETLKTPVEDAFHRLDYEGLSADDQQEIAIEVERFLKNPVFLQLKAE